MIDTGVELPEKLKSHDDDHAKNLRYGEDWHGMSMQRNGKYCMHKMHIIYIYTRYREEKGLRLLLEFVVVVVGEGDSCVKKEESASAELNRRGTVQ
jgi:hypothetical protein